LMTSAPRRRIDSAVGWIRGTGWTVTDPPNHLRPRACL